MEEALFLTKYAGEVLLIHRRDHFRASKIMLDRARKNPKITFLTDTVLEEILGETSVEGVRVKNVKTGEEQTLAVDGFFAAIGHAPSTGIFEGLVEMDESGYILQREHTMTSVPGVFARVLGSALVAWGLLEAVYAVYDRPRPRADGPGLRWPA